MIGDLNLYCSWSCGRKTFCSFITADCADSNSNFELAGYSEYLVKIDHLACRDIGA